MAASIRWEGISDLWRRSGVTRDQLELWVKSGESESLEFKRTTGERREAAQTLCAMLNHRGGRVLFGIQPDHRVVGQQVADKTIEDIAQEIKEIDPPVFPVIERLPVASDREVLCVTATQGHGRPYTYRRQAYKRVGNTSPAMSRDEYKRVLLERLHGEERWENRAADGWSVSDLDAAEITRTLDEAIRRGRAEDPGTRDPGALLQGLGLMHDGRLLRAAVVLFGNAQRLAAAFPQCLLRIARFRGTDKTEFIDNRQLHGNAFELLLRAERFLRDTLPIAGRVVPELFERRDDPMYPPVALREALANAICHRDYSIGGGSVAVGAYDDRLEITSSGTLHFGLTVDALFQAHESLPWNPLIARVLYRRGIIESWGRGTIKMAELTEQAGLPRPEVVEAAGCVTVRFRPKGLGAPEAVAGKLTSRQQLILALLGRHRHLALRAIRAALGPRVADWEVKRDLASLRDLELIDSAGRGRGAFWYLRKH